MEELLSKARCQVIVTHDLSLVRGHCNRCLMLEGGRVEAFGDPSRPHLLGVQWHPEWMHGDAGAGAIFRWLVHGERGPY